ncbi:MAG: hypothetical protein H7256_10565, partial [Bdellovibrio sp.]|nr:hypothetical protein [Bdellovibrio sp.]
MKAAADITSNLGCTNVQSKVFDSFYALIDQEQYIPSAETLNASLDAKLDEIVSHKNLTSDQVENIAALKTELHKLVQVMLSEASENSQLTAKEQIQKLIEYEMGDQSDAATIKATQKIANTADKVKTLSQNLDMACAPSTSADTANSNLTQASLPTGKMTSGINMVFATAYQSCRVLDLPPVERSTASVVGITRVGTHEDGIGGKREVTDLSSVQKTHYYINGIATESQCFSVRNNPLIYDYGGSPSVSGTTINFQKNAGSGTNALGVDCSAYVSSAIAVGGLRYKPAVDNKPIFIRQTSSKFIDAAKSGFTCFDNVTVTPTSSVKAGDI